MDGGGEGVLRGGIKRGWWRRRGVGRDRKERIEGEASQGRAARHLAPVPSPSPLSSPTSSASPLAKETASHPVPRQKSHSLGAAASGLAHHRRRVHGEKNIWFL
jgi:hypothetical protein